MNLIDRCPVRSCLLVALISLVVACGPSSEDTTGTGPPPDTESAEGALPPGHPSLEDVSEGMIAPPPPGSGSGDAGLTWTVPAAWVEEAPANAMRKAQYRVGVMHAAGVGTEADAVEGAERWNVHIGSTGCVSDAPVNAPEEECSAPNRSTIELDLDPQEGQTY